MRRPFEGPQLCSAGLFRASREVRPNGEQRIRGPTLGHPRVPSVRWARAAAGLIGALAFVACGTDPSAPAPSRRERSGAASKATRSPTRSRPVDDVPPLPPSRYPEPSRLVAIGDVHGDVGAFRAALRLGGAIDGDDRWVGGDLFVVQTGDLLDRGDDEPEVLALVARLEREARESGGHFVALQGNHEVMNAQLDFRYVTADGLQDFDAHRDEASPEARRLLPPHQHGRAGAFEPRSIHARTFAARNTAVVVGRTVFVHGGITPEVAALGLDAINQAARDFYLGRGLSPLLTVEFGPLWYRGYALDDSEPTCARLRTALRRLDADRMVIGHTVQDEGIRAACDARLWRIDVGLSRYYGGPVEVLEIAGPSTRVLRGSR